MTWSFRPFFVRPQSEVAFLRPIEGSFAGSVSTSVDSARGIYRRPSAPLPPGAVRPLPAAGQE
jgi:hypothetical protein